MTVTASTMKAMGKAIEREKVKIKNDLVVELFRQLVKATPVCSGTLQYSWRITQDKPSVWRPKIKRQKDCGKGRIYPHPKVPDLGYRNPSRWYITNNQPYVHRVNWGDVDFQGYHFIRPSIEKGVIEIKRKHRG